MMNRTPPKKPIDRKRVMTRFAGVESILLEVTKSSIETFPKLEASIAEANEAGDAEELTRHAHSLRGAAANFDAERTSALAEKIEDLAGEGRIAEAIPIFESLKIELKALQTELVEFQKELETSAGKSN